MKEIWKDIPGYEGIYQASSLGRIRSVEGKKTHSARCGERCWKSRILKGRGDNPTTGKRVSLYKDKKQKDFLVARIIATTFLGFPSEGMTVNHKDGNRMNNHIDNLEWLSLADNIRHGFETGLYHAQKEITISNKGNPQSFRSFSQLDNFLGRSAGYTSGKLKKKATKLTGVSGDVYIVLRIGGVM